MLRWLVIGLLVAGCASTPADGTARYTKGDVSWLRHAHDYTMCGGGSNFVNSAVDRCMERRGYRVVTPGP